MSRHRTSTADTEQMLRNRRSPQQASFQGRYTRHGKVNERLHRPTRNGNRVQDFVRGQANIASRADNVINETMLDINTAPEVDATSRPQSFARMNTPGPIGRPDLGNRSGNTAFSLCEAYRRHAWQAAMRHRLRPLPMQS